MLLNTRHTRLASVATASDEFEREPPSAEFGRDALQMAQAMAPSH
jgi:hypothetical protein